MRLFVDLDGVLVDFDRGVFQATGHYPSEISDQQMWPILARTPGFYDKLEWMSDGKELWEFAKNFSPTILTGLPRGQWAESQKRSWCLRELGPHVPVLTCLSREKGRAASMVLEPDETPVLVDDRLNAQSGWLDIGGVFVLHVSAQDSLRQLKELGFE
jgi:FMN phosphatase YigB (HAD superfamily)